MLKHPTRIFTLKFAFSKFKFVSKLLRCTMQTKFQQIFNPINKENLQEAETYKIQIITNFTEQNGLLMLCLHFNVHTCTLHFPYTVIR